MNFFKQSQTRTDKAHSSQRIVPLRPTAYFIRVLTNCAWHLIETARYERSLEVLQVCLDAWNVFEDKDVDPTIYTHICNHMGVANHWSGNFDQSIRFYEKVYEIYHQIFPVGHYERGNILCNLGNLNLSLGNPEAALEYHLEAKTSFKIGQSADAEIGDQAIISTGRTKCYLDLGRLKEARETVNLSISLCTQRGYLLSRAHKSLLLNEMGSKTHQMLGAAYIRLGCLAQMEGDHTKAISWFRDALKLADFNTFCRGYRARSLYMLSQALQAMPEPQSESIRAEGLSKMHEAKTLLRQILGDRFREELCDNPVTFDNLVVVHVR
ncbi:hypothetical protein F5Y07DRAFT_388775 [Xylaria sp. FL0933]|nr:hypothetical protein F5Y07DRAFT_388775 [Xylaria sp. FL0933]